ncbi:MAG: P1 family peptidase, partial [Gemmatimonadales bacterium]
QIADLTPCLALPADSVSPLLRGFPACPDQLGHGPAAESPADDLAHLEAGLIGTPLEPGAGSIIVVVATDAPLMPSQLQRVAKRVSLAIGRMGGLGENSSGDIFVAFSTARYEADDTGAWDLKAVSSDWMNPIFEATVQAVEEAIVNALVAAETMTGADGFRVYELPEERLREIMAGRGE